ncbi:MAG TPA: nitrous oxide reductase family maturation protein NosD [Ignavibacteria bacterium]|nr:nitrous oxide reductase family maturation protein NosD [Ignavibacteria bacterium]HMR41163.1 nitrous oxide reductase family maturation protein NosD [Ignavibacteria bacterium]
MTAKISYIFLFLIFFYDVASGRDIIVCKNCETVSIKDAIRQSIDGDRIIIKKDIYNENNLVIDKQIEIIGEDHPVIDLEYKYQGFLIQKDHVKITGLEIRNISVNYMEDLSAIKIDNSDHCVIENNILKDTFFAIYLAKANFCLIKNNKISGQAKTETSSGNGVHLWKCTNINLEYNEAEGHRDGFYFEFVTKGTMTGNYSHNNLRYGLHFMFSDSNVYRDNLFRENGAGVAVMYSRNIEMTDNKFEDNWGPASYGLLLKDITRSLVKGNLFYKNTTGIYMEGSDLINVENNEFNSNGWATKILGNCMDNKFTQNNYLNNTFDVSSNSSKNANFYSGNYWDKYDGYDLDKNGTGDVPYRPVSLYSMIVDKVPESIILLRSFIVELIDVTEKAMPVIIPETLIDESPEMNKIKFN